MDALHRKKLLRRASEQHFAGSLSRRKCQDFQHGPFIEEWAFADSDSAVIIKSRGRHGPAHYIKYDLRTGQVIDSVGLSTPYDRMPTWAQPFADDRPNA